MNILQFILFSIAFSLVFCTKQKTTDLIPEKSRDSVLLSHIATEFGYQDALTGRISSQLKTLRNGPKENGKYSIVVEASLRSYRFKAFRFDTQGYPPFIVEVTTSDNELISYFTYTDELYYLDNELRAAWDDSLRFSLEKGNGSPNISYVERVNLDRNFNELLIKLGIENDLTSILKLTDLVFSQLLKLEQYDDVEIDFVMKQIKASDQLRRVLTSEYNLFCNDNSDPTFRYKAKEGALGYWKLMIVSTTEGYKMRSKFFSDALYTAVFL